MREIEEKIFYLKNIKIFHYLTDADLKTFGRISYTTTYGHREAISGHGDSSNVICLLKKGRVKIYKRAREGEERILAILEAGDIFGEMGPVDDDSPRDTITETLDESLVCIVRRREFELFLRKKRELAMRVKKLIGMRRRCIENQLERLLFRTVSSRLAIVLLSLAGSYGVHDGRGIVLRVKLSEQEIANLIGATRETTSALLKELRQRNIIQIRYRRITFLDQWRLKKLADAKTKELEIPSEEEAELSEFDPRSVI